MFGWKKKAATQPRPVETPQVKPPKLTDQHPIWSRPGPRDISEVDVSVGYLDHGAVMIPAVDGMRIAPLGTVKEGMAAGIRLALGTSLIEIEVFAAPRSGNVWSEMRHSLRELAQQMGATVEARTGRYGTEQLVTIPVELPDGGKGQTVVRELGHEGPRWVARIKMLGQAAVDAELSRQFEALIDRIVIVRGPEPRARLELLPVQFETHEPVTLTAGQ